MSTVKIEETKCALRSHNSVKKVSDHWVRPTHSQRLSGAVWNLKSKFVLAFPRYADGDHRHYVTLRIVEHD